MRAAKNPKSPPPMLTSLPRSALPAGSPQNNWPGVGKERVVHQSKGNRLLRALLLMLAITTIMFLVFSAVFSQPMRPEAPARIAKSSSFYHHYHISKMEELVPAMLRGAAHSAHNEQLASDAKQVSQQTGPQQAPPVPSDEADTVVEEEAKEEAAASGPLPAKIQSPPGRVRRAAGRVLIFTMDSISAYEDRSKKGGAAGEIIIRRSLEAGLGEMGLSVEVARSDDEFEHKGTANGGMAKYDVILLDAWTWAAPGWEPKPFLRGHEERIFLLDFFGAPTPTKNGIKVPPTRILTAFDSTPWNTFLGYFMDPPPQRHVDKKPQGVIWGKDPKHYHGKDRVLRAVADRVDLYSTLGDAVIAHPRIKYVGHQSPEGWRSLLSESRFLLGLGDPLLGPSAMDAISVGCVYINPTYPKPVKALYTSQHPYAQEHIGSPYVCSADYDDSDALLACVEGALAADLPPMVPPQLTKSAYMTRLWDIFGPFVHETEGEEGAALPA